MRVLGLLVVLVVVLVAVLLFRTLTLPRVEAEVVALPPLEVDAAAAAARLGEAIAFPTFAGADAGVDDEAMDDDVSPATEDHPAPADPFLALHAWLEASFPKTHATLERETVAGRSLLFTWKAEGSGELPILLMGHLDVVPAGGGWTHPPFSGTVENGFVWGRGSLDDKSSCIAMLEAVETLVTAGFVPRRTVYLAFGHDEEVGGREGATSIAALLEKRGVETAFVLDEGLAVTRGVIKGVERPVALIGLAEKGFVTVELVSEGEGGHTMSPPPKTHIGNLATAIHRLEENQLDTSLEGPSGLMLETLAPYMPFGQRLVIANRWLLGGLLESKLTQTRATNALVRTTTAATIIEGGTRQNVLPRRARALVNFRIRPGQSRDDVIRHVESLVSDLGVTVAAGGGLAGDPSPVSAVEAEGFQSIRDSVRRTFPDAIVAPGLVIGATDARHYTGISRHVYRFMPFTVTPEDLARIHGRDERVPVDDYEKAIQFYGSLLRESAGPKS